MSVKDHAVSFFVGVATGGVAVAAAAVAGTAVNAAVNAVVASDAADAAVATGKAGVVGGVFGGATGSLGVLLVDDVDDAKYKAASFAAGTLAGAAGSIFSRHTSRAHSRRKPQPRPLLHLLPK